jgi:hypothetical protein
MRRTILLSFKYIKLITGKKSALNSAKVLKVVELDFVIDASGKRGILGIVMREQLLQSQHLHYEEQCCLP